ncbi:polyamine aminopropyltransferase [Pseudothauera rhizosphaerae]|uniref:Polyamine aminopropyltransferase n=1 Tax=Pseudothauera rhizosphaerae TaxID=2565932 RepID=A0A4S4AQQ5_9RHOO|nr:polyamine aminopropyltransferase [Pseudothauera rhizosphaerae]THF62027.1 polyamine aminopropyltransferase [Pseudothauera rhizosphaerae]
MSGHDGKATDELLLEWLNEDAGFFYRKGRLLDEGESAFQRYEVWDTPQFGKLFRLDGCFMTSERDEFFYHENLIHVPAIAHPDPRSALIIGGGDGGSAEELFKHPTMQRVVLVELDAKVIDIARQHLQAVHKGALDDPRLELRVEDGLHYVREVAPAIGERFDLIVLDLTDPVGPAEALYSREFLADCKALLTEQGAITLHIGAPIFHPERVRQLVDNLRAAFARVQPYFLYIPLYGSLWGMACASDALDPAALAAAEVNARIAERQLAPLQHYNGAVHCAQFALPNHLRRLLA